MSIINDPIDNALGNAVVASALVTSETTTTVTIAVKLISVGAISGASTDYVTAQNLEKEILTKAGLDDTLSFSTLTEITSYSAGNKMVYLLDIVAALS